MDSKITLLLAGQDYDYFEMLRSYIKTSEKDIKLLPRCNSTESLFVYLQQNPPTILVVEESFCHPETEKIIAESATKGKILIAEKKNTTTPPNWNSVFKFQKIWNILNAIEDEIEKIESETFVGKTKILSFYSPVGGSGKTTLALACTLQLLKESDMRIAYLNFEQPGNSSPYLPREDNLTNILDFLWNHKDIDQIVQSSFARKKVKLTVTDEDIKALLTKYQNRPNKAKQRLELWLEQGWMNRDQASKFFKLARNEGIRYDPEEAQAIIESASSKESAHFEYIHGSSSAFKPCNLDRLAIEQLLDEICAMNIFDLIICDLASEFTAENLLFLKKSDLVITPIIAGLIPEKKIHTFRTLLQKYDSSLKETKFVFLWNKMEEGTPLNDSSVPILATFEFLAGVPTAVNLAELNRVTGKSLNKLMDIVTEHLWQSRYKHVDSPQNV